jgi:hypothetical protein
MLCLIVIGGVQFQSSHTNVRSQAMPDLDKESA